MKPLRVLGHSIHPMATDFPIALWLTSIFWDLIRLWRGEPLWAALAFWTLALGIVAVVPAVISGSIEYSSIPGKNPAMKTATWHMMVMLLAGALFGGSLIVRKGPELLSGSEMIFALALSLSGALVALIGGWFGGELVAHYGVGTEFFKRSFSVNS